MHELVAEYRSIGEERKVPPSSRLSDEQIYETFVLSTAAFRQAAHIKQERVSEATYKGIALKFMGVLEFFGEAYFVDHLKYEVERFHKEGMRDDYVKFGRQYFSFDNERPTEPHFGGITVELMKVCVLAADIILEPHQRNKNARLEVVLFGTAYLFRQLIKKLDQERHHAFVLEYWQSLEDLICDEGLDSYLPSSDIGSFLASRLELYDGEVDSMFNPGPRGHVPLLRSVRLFFETPLAADDSVLSRDLEAMLLLMRKSLELFKLLDGAIDRVHKQGYFER